MAQSTMILPFSIQSKFYDYFEGIFCILQHILKKIL